MIDLYENAVHSIQLSVEDYQANDPKRFLSAVRSLYAGLLLLAKKVLVRQVPNANPEDVLGERYKPVTDGEEGVRFVRASRRRIDFANIGERFKGLGLRID